MSAAASAGDRADGAAVVGVVVIGRNEGERLRRCLQSLGPDVRRAVYVDSGSQDDSVSFARSLGALVVELDPQQPFTAARARNAGFAALERERPCEFVQFVDGDCELAAGWLLRAAAELRADPELAVVFGRRRERARAASIYNRLCDLEWDVPVGEALSCGGDALMRSVALRQCGGFDPGRIAGEEPELCLRLRRGGFRIRRIDAEMTVHDAAMHRFGQWWRRTVRAGYVEAEGLAEHGRGYPRWRSALSNLVWAIGLPVVAAVLLVVGVHRDVLWLWLGAPVAAVLLYLRLWRRIRTTTRNRWGAADSALYATFCVLGKWPATQGMLVWAWRRCVGARRRLIEYKEPAPR
ncbi:MAG: glycosyltransferase family 2 protein [Planctomycetes bacterium]|nr:glycosyltransferase family 2 protein [Planctomycetota bacterium]